MGATSGETVNFLTWYVRRGRITRRVFWLHYVLPFFVLTLLALAVDSAFGYFSLDAAAQQVQAGAAVEYGPLVTGAALLTVIPTIASQATRLHDQGRSAMWLLLNFLPIFGQLILLGICGFVPGQPGPNRYGPPSAAPGAPAAGATPPLPESWAPSPQDRAPDYPPADWR